jgi:AraC-like DNA-binding protein
LEEVDSAATRTPRPNKGVYWRAPALEGVELFRAAFTSHRFARHWHAGYALGAVEGGAERFFCRGSYHTALPQRTVIAVSPGEIHDGEAAAESGWAYRMAYPTEAAVDTVAGELAGRQVTPRLRAPVLDDPQLAQGFLTMHRELESGRVSRLEADAALLGWLTLLLRRHGDLIERPAPPLSARDRRIRTVLAYIDAELAGDIALADLAAIAGIGRFHLLRSFAKELGMTPHAWIAQRRVVHAKALLDSGRSASEAALAAGFFDQSHFSNRFRRTYGMTPGEYRRGAYSRR